MSNKVIMERLASFDVARQKRNQLRNSAEELLTACKVVQPAIHAERCADGGHSALCSLLQEAIQRVEA